MAASGWWRRGPMRVVLWSAIRLRELNDHIPNVETRVVAIFRGGRSIIP